MTFDEHVKAAALAVHSAAVVFYKRRRPDGQGVELACSLRTFNFDQSDARDAIQNLIEAFAKQVSAGDRKSPESIRRNAPIVPSA